MLLVATVLVIVVGGAVVLAFARRERTPQTPQVDGPAPDPAHAPPTHPKHDPET